MVTCTWIDGHVDTKLHAHEYTTTCMWVHGHVYADTKPVDTPRIRVRFKVDSTLWLIAHNKILPNGPQR
jgi:hypothetical protein